MQIHGNLPCNGKQGSDLAYFHVEGDRIFKVQGMSFQEILQ